MNNFPSNYALVPPVSYPSDRPPYVPPQVMVHSSVQQYLVYVCSAIATLAGATSSANAARMFSYNALSSQGWVNPDYSEIVQLGIDYLALSFQKNMISGDVPSFIKNLAGTLVGYKAGQCASRFPQLLESAGNNYQHAKAEADQFAQAYYAMQTEAMQWRNAGGGGQPMNHMHQPAQQHYGPSFQGHAPVHTLPNIAHAAMGRASAAPRTQPINVGSLVSNAPPPVVPVANDATRVFSRTELVMRNHQAQQAQQPQYQGGAPVYTPPPVQAPEPELEWSASELQRHPPLIHSLVEDAELVTTDVGNGETVVSYQTTILTEEQQMERAAHVIHPTARPLTRYTPEAGTRLEGLEQGLRDVTASVATPKEAISQVKGYVPNMLLNTYDLDQAMRAARYYHKVYVGAESQATVFSVSAQFTETFYAVADYTFEIQEIAKAGTLLGVAKKIQSYLNSKAEPYELKAILFQLDRLLTQRINDVLWNNMGVTIATLDSFAADIPALLDLLHKHPNYGELYVNALNRHAEQFIDSWMSFELSEDQEFDQVQTQFAPDTVPVQHRLTYTASLTNIELLFEELNIRFSESGLACEIHRSSLPALWEFVHARFTTSDPDIPAPIRFFLTTLDGYVLELHRGFLDDNTYLMSIHRS